MNADIVVTGSRAGAGVKAKTVTNPNVRARVRLRVERNTGVISPGARSAGNAGRTVNPRPTRGRIA